MQVVEVDQFGGVEHLHVRETRTPEPGPGQVRVRLTSIGMNYAELMARRGAYRLTSGDPPFTPGLEGGGVIEAIGDRVDSARLNQRVTLSPAAPRGRDGGMKGTYRSHFICDAEDAMPAPDAVPDDQLGALWLPYLTAWGCLIWKQQLQPGELVAMPAASSSVALAAAQLVKQIGGTAIGMTRSEAKAKKLAQLKTAVYDDVVVTHDANGAMRPWHREFKKLTEGRGVDVFFDPVAAGEYLSSEVKSLAQHGCVWVYGLLAQSGPVDVTPLIRKHAAIRGWALTELIEAGRTAWQPGCEQIFAGLADGRYQQHVDAVFKLEQVRDAQAYMERGEHVGKLVLVP